MAQKDTTLIDTYMQLLFNMDVGDFILAPHLWAELYEISQKVGKEILIKSLEKTLP